MINKNLLTWKNRKTHHLTDGKQNISVSFIKCQKKDSDFALSETTNSLKDSNTHEENSLNCRYVRAEGRGSIDMTLDTLNISDFRKYGSSAQKIPIKKFLNGGNKLEQEEIYQNHSDSDWVWLYS